MKWVVVDVETTGIDPQRHRVISVAALALADDGSVEKSLVSLLDPGVDPGPTEVHGLTRAMLTGQPQFSAIASRIEDMVRGRILVAHNAVFDYGFLSAEMGRCGRVLPAEAVLCTVELARELDLRTPNLKLATLAQHWEVAQTRPHDAYDDAHVRSQVLVRALARARQLGVVVPVRSAGKTSPGPLSRYGRTAA